MSGGGRKLERRLAGRHERELGRCARWLAARHDLGAHGAVGSEHAVVAHHVESGRWDEGSEPGDEIERLEQDGVSAVFPWSLEAEAYAAVGMEREALPSERRPSEVAAQPFEALAVAAVDDDLRVYVDSTDFGQQLIGRRHEAHGLNELGCLLTRRGAEQLHVVRRRGVARGEHRLLARPRFGCGVLERAAVTLEHARDGRVGPGRHLGELLGVRRRQRMEDERALLVTDADAVEGEGVEVASGAAAFVAEEL
jgi:hypothetical protein